VLDDHPGAGRRSVTSVRAIAVDTRSLFGVVLALQHHEYRDRGQADDGDRDGRRGLQPDAQCGPAQYLLVGRAGCHRSEPSW